MTGGLLPLSPRGSPRRRLAILCFALSLCGLAAAWDFSLIGRRADQLYGTQNAGRENLDAWQQLLREHQGAGEEEKLQAVNRFFNLRLRFRDDLELWHVREYWATPVEALYKGAGDCEDFAIAKYFSLRHLGVSGEKLHITYVKSRPLNQAHMVLTYYPHPKAIPLVLDNLIDAIEPATLRTDLIPVYAFNTEGLWSGSRRQVGDSKHLSRWQDLLRKMQAEGFP